MNTDLKPRYVILCGGRDHPAFTPPQVAWLDTLHAVQPFAELLIGSDDGADDNGRQWAYTREINCVTFWANWTKHGKSAGPIRNGRMLKHIMARSFHVAHDLCALALVIAFPGGRGTADMCRQAMDAGVIVTRWQDQALVL